MAVELVETIEVELADGSPAVINKTDFNPAVHRLPGAAAETPAADTGGGAEAPAAKKSAKKTE